MKMIKTATTLSLLVSAAVLACLAACNFPVPESPIPPTPSPESVLNSATPPETTGEPTPTEAAVEPALAVIGPEQVVFDWTFDACEPDDIPDLPARAFRDDQGLVHLISAHIRGRAYVGESLDELERACDVISESDHDPDPSRFNDSEWLSGVYTEDGRTIYAIVHNEYHGWEHEGCPSEDHFACWYNSLTLAVSNDGGRNFVDVAAPPDHFVAGLPIPYEAGAGPFGLFESSNIVKGPGGFYYLFARVDDFRSPEQWICLLRSDDLSDPKSWRAWDGQDFNMTFIDPYRQPDTAPGDHTCTAVGGDELGLMDSSVTFNTILDRYVMVGLSADHLDGREVWGIYYAFSDDLLNWTHRRLLWEVPLPWSYQPGDAYTILYPSLLNSQSTSLSFETSGQQNYLYFTRFNIENSGSSLDRDLVRIPVGVFPSADEALAADSRTRLSLQADPAPGDRVAIEGQLSTYGGMPVEGVEIELSATPLDGPGERQTYAITGEVPEGAESALIGYRVNTECGCTGQADFSIFEISYMEAGNPENLLADPAFSQGLDEGTLWGEAAAELSPSEDDGNVLHVQAEEGQVAGGHLSGTAVTPSATFTATLEARVAPISAGSGYFLILFSDSDGEILRYRIDLLPAAFPLGSVITAAGGAFNFEGLAPAGTVLITARYAGDEHNWAAVAEAQVSR